MEIAASNDSTSCNNPRVPGAPPATLSDRPENGSYGNGISGKRGVQNENGHGAIASFEKPSFHDRIEGRVTEAMAEMKVDPNNRSHGELLAQGIRAFHLGEFGSAVQALSQATELLVREHGADVHDSLGDVYFYYGRSLLELSRVEAQPLGDAVPREADSDDEEEAEAEAEGEGEQEDGEGAGAGGDPEEAAAKEGEDKEVEAMEVESSEAQPSTSSGEAAGPSTSSDKTAAESTEDEEPSDLQVGWEVLELAKQIFKARGGPGEKHLAETLIALGEISLENEKYEDAVNDMTQGLNIQKKLFEPDNRALAETYYKLGVVYGTNTQLDEAMTNFEEALKCLRTRLAKLEAIERKSVDDELEIGDIQDLIPVIEEKITDMKSYKEEVRNGVNNLLKGGPDSSSSTTNGVTEKPESSKDEKTEKPTEVVNNISHLVRRKRPRESTEPAETDGYKPVEKQVC